MPPEESLENDLKDSGLSERQQTLLMLCPGTLFGFPDPDLPRYMARLDCPACQRVFDPARQVKVLIGALSPEVSSEWKRDFEAYERDKARHARHSALPLVGRAYAKLTPPPQEPPRPAAITAIEDAARLVIAATKEAESNHPEHWAGAGELRASKHVLTFMLGLPTVAELDVQQR